MSEQQPKTGGKEVVQVHVEYRDKDGNVYSINDVEVPVETTLKNTEDTSSNSEETNTVFSPEVLKILKGVGLSEHQEK